jgi:hypothetical protein
MNQRTFIQSQILEVDQLLGLAGNHPLMSPALRERKAALQNDLNQLPPASKEARTILFFTGAPVTGSVGIDAEFASKVLGPFVEMVKTQYSASKHGGVGLRGPRRGESEAKLLLTGLPRGSFGLELSAPEDGGLFPNEQLSNSLVSLTKVIRTAAESDEGFAMAFEDAAPRLLGRLKEFFKVISDNRADVRLVTGDIEFRLTTAEVSQAFDRVNGAQTAENNVQKIGTFRGATLDSRRFDFHPDEGDLISGRLSETLQEEDALRMIQLTQQRCIARFQTSTVTTRSGAARTQYELVALDRALD